MPLPVLVRILTFVAAIVIGLIAYIQLWERGEAEIRSGKRPPPRTSAGQLLLGARPPAEHGGESFCFYAKLRC